MVWHGKGNKAIARIKTLDDMLLCRDGYEYSRLWWNLHTVSCYIRNNTHTLVNYGARYRKGLPISSSVAESAVNLVVSHRMAKKRQMRSMAIASDSRCITWRGERVRKFEDLRSV